MRRSFAEMEPDNVMDTGFAFSNLNISPSMGLGCIRSLTTTMSVSILLTIPQLPSVEHVFLITDRRPSMLLLR